MTSDLDNILPAGITERAARAGNEWIIPLAEARQAVSVASENLIAILGVESLRILDDGFLVLNYSGYGFDFKNDWPAYVGMNNNAALRYLEEHPLGQGEGYVLTSSSRREHP
jgi:hypothetical protein